MEVATERTTRPVSELRPNPLNPRGDVTSNHIEELAASIRAQGVLQPLLVTPDGTVVAGHRRLAAANLAGLVHVPVVERELSVSEQLEIMLIENLQREDLTPLQEALAYQRMRDLGYEKSEIARRVGVSANRIQERLYILQLDPAVQEMFASNDLPTSLIRPLRKVGDPAMQRRLATMSVRRRLSVAKLEEIIDRGQGVLSGKERPKRAAPKTGGKAVKGTSRKLALDLLRRAPAAKVSCSELAKAMDAICGVCGDCGMSSLEDICKECPLPQLIARLVA